MHTHTRPLREEACFTFRYLFFGVLLVRIGKHSECSFSSVMHRVCLHFQFTNVHFAYVISLDRRFAGARAYSVQLRSGYIRP